MALITLDKPLIYNGIALELLEMKHCQDLCQATQDGKLWQIDYASIPHPEQMQSYIHTALQTPDRVAFAVIDCTTQRVIGTTSYYYVEPKIQRLYIGYTWYAQQYWRTHVNSTCKYLLLDYAFNHLNYAVVAWQTDILNQRSQRAIERLGAKKDGILRHHQARRDGSVRDTVVYSMLRQEWFEQHQAHLLNILNQQLRA